MFRVIHPNRWLCWTIALVVMVFIVVWGAIQYFIIEQEYQSTQLPVEQLRREPSQLETVGWKTYRNEEYGFEFKYPSENGQYELLGLNKIDNAHSLADCSITNCGESFLTFYIREYKSLQDWYDTYLAPYKDTAARKPCWSTLQMEANRYKCLYNGNDSLYIYSAKNGVLEIYANQDKIPFNFFDTLTFFEPKR